MFMSLYKQNIMKMEDLTRGDIDGILRSARDISKHIDNKRFYTSLTGSVIGLLFFEPSTRTRMSFDIAASKLGARVYNFGSIDSSSIMKGETLEDTFRIVGSYVDCAVIRHPSEDIVQLASEIMDVPVINAGDGAGNHPSQTFVDLYTLFSECNKSNNEHISITLAGDLKYSRTIHSLCSALAYYDVEVFAVATSDLGLPEYYKKRFSEYGISFSEHNTIDETLGKSDALYLTRLQEERFSGFVSYPCCNHIKINQDMINRLNPDVRILHPLPRGDEIPSEIDYLDNACYFVQAENCVPVRMALLKHVLLGMG